MFSEKCHGKSDEELVSLTLENQDYYYCIMKRYEEKLLRYILRISNIAKEDAEDILQDTFIKAYKNLNSFDVSLKFSSWIYRIARNTTISHHRKHKFPSQEFTDELMNKLVDKQDIPKEIDRNINKREIEKTLSQMKDIYKEILILKFLEEKNYKEISDILQKPLGTVAALINRAKKEFREKFNKNFNE